MTMVDKDEFMPQVSTKLMLISTAAGLRQPLGQGSTRSAAALRESSELSGG